MRSVIVLSIVVAASCTHRTPLREGPVGRVGPSRSAPMAQVPRPLQLPTELIRAARRNAESVLGSGLDVGRRDEVALLAAKLAAALARVDAAERRDVRRLFRRLPRLARELIPAISVRPGPGEAALLGALDLGHRAEVLPKTLAGIRLGMSRAELQASRPDAYRPRRRWSRWWTLPAVAGSPYHDARCRFTRSQLEECRVKLRLTRFWPALGAKVTAKWGTPRSRRRGRWRWRLQGARVTMHLSRSGGYRQVELRIRRRWSSRRLSSWRSSWGRSGSPRSWFGGPSSSLGSLGRRLGSSRSRRRVGLSSSLSASLGSFVTRSRRASRYLAFGTGPNSRGRGRPTRIRRTGPGRYEIPRRVFSGMFARPQALQREVRMVPHEVAGVLGGLRLYDLRFGGRLRRLGLRNGDLVTRIGGIRLSSAAKILEALGGLRHRRHFGMDIERVGRVLTLSYHVLD